MSYVTGKTVKKLREKLKITQRELAQRINVSDKTISKWETEKGLPDIGILEELAKALGVSAAELLTGDFKENENPSGNMKKLHFYVCPVCGNIITAVGQSSISCCGVSLPELLAESEEDMHGIAVETVDHEYCVTMAHPMEKKHYISFIAYVTADSCEVIKLYPEQGISVRFRKKGHGILYVYCNRHGMFAVHSYRKLPAHDGTGYVPHRDTHPLRDARTRMRALLLLRRGRLRLRASSISLSSRS